MLIPPKIFRKRPNDKTASASLIITVFFVVLIPVVFLLYQNNCRTESKNYRDNILSSVNNAKNFKEFSDNLFRYEVTNNSVTTAFTLKNPEEYGIPDLSPVLNDISARQYSKDAKGKISKKIIDRIQKKLSAFPKENLTGKDQLIYELIDKHLTLSKEMSKYSYYETMLGKSSGAFAKLPVTLCEYPLDDEDDVKTYLTLVSQVPYYFKNVIEYENDKAKHNMPTPVFLLKESRSELENLIKNLKTDDNCFVTTFNERIKNIEDISVKNKKKYISNNRYYVNRYIIPAYEEIYDYIYTSIRNSGSSNSKISQSQSKNKENLPDLDTSYGLSSYKNGKKYYELLVRDATGSDKTVNDLITMTETTLNNTLSEVLRIATTDTDAYLYYCDHPLESGFHSPDGILTALSMMMRNDYPPLDKTPSYTVRKVPDSLSDMLSPAFYLIPRIDNYDNNIIYINPQYTSEANGNIFTTLAHEGFPGHLYQTVYFNNTDPAPIRQILDYPGYVEGWATYVELNSFSFIDHPQYAESLPALYRSDSIISLALSSRIDIGVNYEGWTLNDTCKYFEDLGFNSYYAGDIYSYVVEAPANYLSYFIGYLEIMQLKTDYKNLKMENYSEIEFHRALLDIGPADFATIRKYLLR